MKPEDRDMIRGFLAGSPDMVRQIDRWIAAAVGSFRPALGNDWEDLLQDVRLEATHRFQAEEFRGEAELKTYVWRIAVHAAISRVRKAAIRNHMPLDSVPPPLSSATSPLERLLRTEEGLVALRILDESAGPCRDLWSHILRGRSYAEMSEEMGIAAGTLRARVRRCRQSAIQLRERLLTSPVEPSGRNGG